MHDSHDIPRAFAGDTHTSAPPGYTAGWARMADLQAAGFHRDEKYEERKPGSPPLDELLLVGLQEISADVASQVMAEALFPALRDADGVIVATWDEGRWWTPEESEQLMAALIAEARGGR